MLSMHRRSTPIAFAVLAVLTLSLAAVSTTAFAQHARKYKAPPPTARIEVTVIRNDDGKPLENAAVVFHPMHNGKDEGNMELKTNEDGKAVIDVIAIGDTIRLQVLAKGYQTYGQDYSVDKDSLSIGVRLKRPQRQYSTYEHHDDQGQNPESNKDKPQEKPQ